MHAVQLFFQRITYNTFLQQVGRVSSSSECM